MNGDGRPVCDEGRDGRGDVAGQLGAAQRLDVAIDCGVAGVPEGPGGMINAVLDRVLARLAVVAPVTLCEKLLE